MRRLDLHLAHVCPRVSLDVPVDRVVVLEGKGGDQAAHARGGMGRRVITRTPADREAGLAAGADAYLAKPFSPIQLLNITERALERESGTS